ncbi:MAG: ERF family protein [Syntrophobacteraceae bacterium]
MATAAQETSAADKPNGKAKVIEIAPAMPCNLAGKIAAIMGEISRVAKSGRNDFHKYDYVTEADLSDSIRPLLAKYGVSLMASVESFEMGGNNIASVWMNFTLTCADSGESQTSRFPGMGQDKADKGVYKAITGATKYWMFKTFLVSTGDDPEKDHDMQGQNQNQNAAGKKRAPAQQNVSPVNQQQADDTAAQLRDWAVYEADAEKMKKLTTCEAIDKFIQGNIAKIDANMYGSYWHTMADDLRKQIDEGSAH